MGCHQMRPPCLLHDSTTESESEPHSSGFGCLVSLKQALRHLRRHSGTVVIDLDDRPTVAVDHANEDASACVSAFRGGIDRIADDVVEDLLDSDRVALDERDRMNALDDDVDAARVCAFHTERPDFQGCIDEIQWPRLQSADRDKVADALQHLARSLRLGLGLA